MPIKSTMPPAMLNGRIAREAVRIERTSCVAAIAVNAMPTPFVNAKAMNMKMMWSAMMIVMCGRSHASSRAPLVRRLLRYALTKRPGRGGRPRIRAPQSPQLPFFYRCAIGCSRSRGSGRHAQEHGATDGRGISRRRHLVEEFMIRRAFFAVLALMLSVPLAAAAAPPSPGASQGGEESGPQPYADFIKGATIQAGLFPIIAKDDKVYIAIAGTQIGKQFIETSVPTTGFGGLGPAPGEPYVAPARMIEFDRVGHKVVIRWPNTYFSAAPDSPRASGVAESFPNSVIAVEPITAEDASSGTIVISASPFLGDVAYLGAVFQAEVDSPEHGYRLDPDRSYFMRTDAFPSNDLLEVSQTWVSENPDLIDNTPDARLVEVHIEYNLVAPPADGYMPRIADDRVGFFTLPQLNFGSDLTRTRQQYFLSRWNFAPATPGKPSPATHPMVFTIAKDVPEEYRG